MIEKKFITKLHNLVHSPEKVFISALLVAVFCTLCTVLFLSDIYRDTANVYAVYAREIGRGNWYDGIATGVPMLNILLAGLLSRCGLEAVKALSLIAGLFYIATCFPLRKLLERYDSPLMAAWGCMLFVCAPKIVRFACAPLLDSASIFLVTAGLLFFLRLSEQPTAKDGALFGLSAGFLAAARGESFIISVALIFGLPLFAALFKRPPAWRKLLLCWLLAACCATAAVSPFCTMNYCKSGYFVTDARVVGYTKIFGKALGLIPVKSAEERSKLFTSNANGNHNWRAKFGHLFSCLMRGGYELYIALAALGAIVIICRKELKSDYLVIIGLTLLYFAIFLFTVSATRYYLFVVPFYMVFTITGANLIYKLSCRYVPKYIPLLCVCAGVILAAQVGNGLKRSFSGNGKEELTVGKWIGEWLRENIEGREALIYAPGATEVAYWSGAEHTAGYEDPERDPATFNDFDLAVVRSKNSFGLENRKDLERLEETPYAQDYWIFKPMARTE